MRNDDQWWLDDSHPDALAHREFLAKHEVKEVATLAASKPPARRKRAAPRASVSDFEMFGRCMRDAIAPLQKRIEELEASQASPFKFVGTWSQGMEVVAGNFVSYAGSMWHCNEATTAKPGTGPEFTLCVKRGRDGKDAK